MTSVVIVGSGFIGFECARRLSRQLRKHASADASVDIAMVSPVDYMLYTPLLPDVAGGHARLGHPVVRHPRSG